MDGVIRVRHVGGGRKKYAFAVPEALAAHCHRGDELLVETRYGLRIARAVTEVLRGAKAEEQAKKAGGREALRPVVGVIAPVVRQHVREGLYAELADGLRTRSYAEREALREADRPQSAEVEALLAMDGKTMESLNHCCDPLRIVWVGAEAGDNAEADPLRIVGAGTEMEDNAEARCATQTRVGREWGYKK